MTKQLHAEILPGSIRQSKRKEERKHLGLWRPVGERLPGLPRGLASPQLSRASVWSLGIRCPRGPTRDSPGLNDGTQGTPWVSGFWIPATLPPVSPSVRGPQISDLSCPRRSRSWKPQPTQGHSGAWVPGRRRLCGRRGRWCPGLAEEGFRVLGRKGPVAPASVPF